MGTRLHALYSELADWWQVLSPTSDYADEAAFFRTLFKEAGVRTLLELGAGGGNIAWYLKRDFTITLTDLSPAMLEMSGKQNPEIEHIAGDMRSLRLRRTFDAVFIHDAIMYMLSAEELRAAFETAHEHLASGGFLVVAPDCTQETFEETTHYEGHDSGGRAARYMQWISDPDPGDSIFNYDIVIALKENGELRTVIDGQICGLFPRQTWLDLLSDSGFSATAVPDSSDDDEEGSRREVFVGYRK